MPIIADFGMSIQEYAALGKEGVRRLEMPGDVRRCWRCPDGHPLRLHSLYARGADEADESYEVWIRLLYCAVKKKSVAVLPSFLAPYKRHTWRDIGKFFEELVEKGRTFEEAMEACMKEYASRQKGEHWCRSLIRNWGKIAQYLSSAYPWFTPRQAPTPRHTGELRSPAVFLIQWLTGVVEAPVAEALQFHNVQMDKRLNVFLFAPVRR